MSSDTLDHRDRHNGDMHPQTEAEPARTCCGAKAACGDVAPARPDPNRGRSFQVSGLDCAEEVAILSRIVGPSIWPSMSSTGA